VRRGQLSEHPVVLDESEEGILMRTEARHSEVFDEEWRGHLRAAPEDLRLIITQDRIYLEKVH
jgi:hypothetical protein